MLLNQVNNPCLDSQITENEVVPAIKNANDKLVPGPKGVLQRLL